MRNHEDTCGGEYRHVPSRAEALLARLRAGRLVSTVRVVLLSRHCAKNKIEINCIERMHSVQCVPARWVPGFESGWGGLHLLSRAARDCSQGPTDLQPSSLRCAARCYLSSSSLEHFRCSFLPLRTQQTSVAALGVPNSDPEGSGQMDAELASSVTRQISSLTLWWLTRATHAWRAEMTDPGYSSSWYQQSPSQRIVQHRIAKVQHRKGDATCNSTPKNQKKRSNRTIQPQASSSSSAKSFAFLLPPPLSGWVSCS